MHHLTVLEKMCRFSDFIYPAFAAANGCVIVIMVEKQLKNAAHLSFPVSECRAEDLVWLQLETVV